MSKPPRRRKLALWGGISCRGFCLHSAGFSDQFCRGSSLPRKRLKNYRPLLLAVRARPCGSCGTRHRLTGARSCAISSRRNSRCHAAFFSPGFFLLHSSSTAGL